MPPAEKGRTRQYCLVHCIWHLLFQSKPLTLWTGSDEAGDVYEAGGPVVAGSLKFADRLVTTMVAAETAVTGLDEMDVFWRYGK